MNVSLSYRVVFSIEKNIVPQFGNAFLSLSKNIILKDHIIIYPLNQIEVCDYNPRCFVSSGLMFDDIIMNMIGNKALEYHKEGVYSF